MKNYRYLTACLLLIVASCNPDDKFTGVWNKDPNPEFDATAFPMWNKRGKYLMDTNVAKTPLFLRIKKEIGYYVMNCYQFDAPKNSMVNDPSVFDFVKFTKEDEFTLISDNRASKIATENRIIIQLDPATGELTMHFPSDKIELPTEKKTNALFRTMFSSGFHKVMDIRRRTNDPGIMDSKMKESRIILNQ